jgi:hypothetical protein
LEVNTSRLETAHSIRKSIDLFLKNELFPKLELLFDEYGFQDEIVRIQKLSLNLSVMDGNEIRDIKDEIYRQLKEKIDLLIPEIQDISGQYSKTSNSGDQKIKRISEIRNSGNIFLFFLENGYLPWYGKEEQLRSFTQPLTWETSLNNQNFFEELDRILGTSDPVADRFIIQFSDEMITAYLRRKNLRIHAETSAILKICKGLDKDGRRIFLKLLIRIANDDFPGVSKSLERLILRVSEANNPLSEKKEVQQLKTLLHRILPENMLDDSVLAKIDRIVENKPLNQDDNTQFQEPTPDIFLENEEENIWVQNAGLILLHPFLKPFFTLIGIAGKQGNLLNENLDLAVQTMHFIATGNENVFESSLVFEKFLCGVPLKRPVQQESLLTESIKTEANDLLTEVIRYWPALKNTSPDGLRQMFIQRDGRLIQEDAKYRLIVERKAQDVLLDKLSWNISVIKLPWISKILFTEW